MTDHLPQVGIMNSLGALMPSILDAVSAGNRRGGSGIARTRRRTMLPCSLPPLQQDSGERQDIVLDEGYPNPPVGRASKKTPKRQPVLLSV